MINVFKDEYRFLSNFYPCSIRYKGRIFNSSEAAYMSEKSDDSFWKNECATSTKPGQIKRRSRTIQLKDNWDNIRLQIMEEVLTIKFQNPLLRSLLLKTGDQELIEGNTWNDTFWGVNIFTQEGENNLGKILMKIRKQIKDEL